MHRATRPQLSFPLRLLLLLLALATALPAGAEGRRAVAAPPPPGPPEGPVVSIEPRYFPETGHYVSGRFRQHWAAHGGLPIFGLPLTDVFYEVAPDNGRTYLTQYFERARFEYHAGRTRPYDVGLTLLGLEAARSRGDEAPFRPAPDRRDPAGAFVAATGHNLSGAFLAFWRAHDGLRNFGWPISEAFAETSASDGRQYLVQYFERERFEYHPEYAATDAEVLLGQLGREHLLRAGVSAAEGAPEAAPPTGKWIPYGVGFYPERAQPGELGVNAYLVGSDDDGAAAFNDGALRRANEAGFGWVRLQLVWRDFERGPGEYDWTPLDRRVAAAAAHGQQTLISVVKSPAWAAPARPGGLPEGAGVAAFGATMGAITARYRGLVRAYEIWNEPNLAAETGGRVDVAAYAATLRAGYEGVKAVDRSAAVVFAGLASTALDDPAVAVDDTAFLRRFYALDGGAWARFFDALGAHPYGAANPPEARWPDDPGAGRCPPAFASAGRPCYRDGREFYFRRVEELRAIMEGGGDAAKQIWLTEFGWTSCGAGPVPAAYEYCALLTEEGQADYVVRAIAYARANWPWLGVMALWNLNYATIPGIDPAHEAVGWSLLRADGAPRPAFEAVGALSK